MEHSAGGASVVRASRRQWEGPIGLGLVVLFLLMGHQVWLIGISLGGFGPHHVLFVIHAALGLWASYSGLRRGDALNRLLCLPVLLCFIAAVSLLYMRAQAY